MEARARVEFADSVKDYKADTLVRPVTVIIPSYNTPSAKLQRAIDSASGQADRVIVFDDASTVDVTRLNLASNVEIVSLGTLLPVGVCTARNHAISCAESESLIVPLDADDWLEPGAIEALRFAYDEQTFVYGDWYEHVNDHKPKYVSAAPIGMIDRKNVCFAPCM